MSTWEFRIPEVIFTGNGSLGQVGPQARLRGRRALIVSDPVMANLGRVAEVQQLLAEAGVSSTAFTGVENEPTDVMVGAGLTMLGDEKCDLVVALGGGSPIDAAKAIAFLSTNGGAIADYMGQGKVRVPGLPLIAIPTTAGTGSEVTKFTIITDTRTDVKMLIGSPLLIPTVAIVDPDLTLSVPPRVTADTGVDALTHAIEAYISRRAQPLTNELALSAIRLISGNLRQAWANGQDLTARNAVMLGSLKAGMAFSNASVALVHGMSRPIGAVFHVPHGLSNALLLPTVMEYTWPAVPQRFADIAAAMGERMGELTAVEAALKALQSVSRLCSDLRIPSLTQLGINRDRFLEMAPKMAEDALLSGSPANNPRTPGKQEIIDLYQKVAAV